MLKNLKSLFIVEDESDKSKPSNKAKSQTPATNQKPVSTPVPDTVPVQNSTGPGKVSKKFTNVLLGAMDKNNIDGFDFLEYKQALQNLASMNMDDETKYKSAFAMAKTMGATLAQLVKTAQFYLDVLKKEEDKFNVALTNQRSKQIDGKHQKMKQLDQTIQKKTAQIKKLQEEIKQHQQQQQKLKSEIGGAAAKVEATQKDFVASYQHITRQIMKDVENMKRYLQGQ